MIATALRRALLIMAAVSLFVAFLRFPARLSIDIFHTIIELPLSLAILLAAIAVLGAMALWRVLRWLLAGARSRQSRLARAQKALARSQVAIAAGDHARALRESARALNLMPEHAAAGLILQAEAAELDGDLELARSTYERLAEMPETRFLGLRGKLRLCLKADDRPRAFALAREVFAARPDSDWAADILVALALTAGESELALSTIDAALRAKSYDRPRAKRRRALVHYFDAQGAAAHEAKDKARDLAMDAHELAPDHVAFAAFAARAQAAAGEAERGVQILERCFSARPHPALIAALSEIFPHDPPGLRKTRVADLVRRRMDHIESRLALSEAALNAGEIAEARRALGPAGQASSFRSALLMARLTRESGQGGEAAARLEAARLFEAARHLPRDDLWHCAECEERAPDWTPLCPRCGALDGWIWTDAGQLPSAPAEDSAPQFVAPAVMRPPDDPGIESHSNSRLSGWRKRVPWLS